jgi:hypothetical protein
MPNLGLCPLQPVVPFVAGFRSDPLGDVLDGDRLPIDGHAGEIEVSRSHDV